MGVCVRKGQRDPCVCLIYLLSIDADECRKLVRSHFLPDDLDGLHDDAHLTALAVVLDAQRQWRGCCPCVVVCMRFVHSQKSMIQRCLRKASQKQTQDAPQTSPATGLMNKLVVHTSMVTRPPPSTICGSSGGSYRG